MEKVFKTNIYGVEIMFTTDESDESTARTVDDVKAVIAEKIEESSSVNVAKASIFACLDLCDERNQARDEVEKLREEILRLSKRNRTRGMTEKRHSRSSNGFGRKSSI